MYIGGDEVATHDAKQGFEAGVFDFGAASHLRTLFFDVLVDGAAVELFEGEAGDIAIRIEVVGEVNAASGFVGLLIEVDGTNTVLHFLEVGSDIDNIVHAAHIAEKANEASLVEFGKFFGDTHAVEFGLGKVFVLKYVSWNAGNVLLDEGVAVDEVVDAIGRENVLEFESVDARGIGLFYVEVVRVVVVEIGDADTEGTGVAEVAEVDAIDTKVLVQATGISTDFELGVNADELGVKGMAQFMGVHDGEPESFASARVIVRDRAIKTCEIVIDRRDLDLAPKAVKVLPKERRGRVFDFAAADHRERQLKAGAGWRG